MWVDLRVPRLDASAVIDELLMLRGAPEPLEVGEIRLDPDPPAAGPEVEISVRVPGGSATRVVAAANRATNVLAERIRTWDR